jgi:putative membrane protein
MTQQMGGAKRPPRAVPSGIRAASRPVCDRWTRHCDNPVTVEHPQIHWFADPAVLAPLLLLAVIYVRRFREARQEAGGRGATAWHALAFAGAMLALLGALVTPVDGLGEDYLFSAHMFQHVLLGDVAPLLLLLSLSRVILRPVTRRLMGFERALGPFASPITAIFIWLGTMYLWHVPALYDAAIRHPLVHVLEHMSFFAAGIALWWPLVQPIPMRRRLTGLQPLAYIASAKGGLAALGLVLAWSSTAFYPFYEHAPRIWGLTAVEDQNVAGVIMMVEQSLTLVLVMVWVFVRMLSQSEQEQLRRERLEELDAVRSALDA